MPSQSQLDDPATIRVCLRCVLPAHACDDKRSACPFNAIGSYGQASKRKAAQVAEAHAAYHEAPAKKKGYANAN